MSVRSYQRNRALGVTGTRMPTCLPAALEQISPNNHLSPAVYRSYRRYAKNSDDYTSKREQNARKRGIVDEIAPYLGNFTCRDIEMELAPTEQIFTEMIGWYSKLGWRIAVNLVDTKDPLHSVGLIPEKWGRYKLMSNYVPDELGKLATLHQIFPHLYQPEGELTRYNRYLEANVLIVPNE